MKPKNETTATTETRWGFTDQEFLARYYELKGNKSKFGKELGVSHTAIGKRVKQIIGNAEDTSKQKKGGSVALIVEAKVAAAAQNGFTQDIQEAAHQMRSLSKLENLLTHVENNLSKVAEKLSASEKPNIVFIKTLVTLVREGRGLITDSFTIKKDLFNMKGMASFMEAVLQVMEEYDPEVRKKLYVRLSQLGMGEQINGFDETSLS